MNENPPLLKLSALADNIGAAPQDDEAVGAPPIDG